MQLIGLLTAAAVAAFLLTGWFRAYALRASLIDVPNARSSHSTPTPRGGGLSVALVLLLSLPAAGLWIGLPANALIALTAGGIAVAAVGWLDDHADVPARWRMLVHIAASILVVILAGGIPALPLPSVAWDWGWLGGVVLAGGIVWHLNLYNFMDGIDGIAGAQAVTVTFPAAVMLWLLDAPGWALLAALIAAASAGFLVWNWPPAKVFMGDAGSGLLGFILASFGVLAWTEAGMSIWVWPILMGVFVVDATWTLIHRMIRGERFWEAHRSHAYQHAARFHGAHRPVTLAVALMNLVWLTPLAWMAAFWPQWGVALTGLAWLPLGGLCMHYGAGEPG